MTKQFIDLGGSNANNMINFANKYKNVTQIRLEENFRSTKAIVTVADTLIKNNQNRLDKEMFSVRTKGMSNVITTRFINEFEQYYSIADNILKHKNEGISFSSMAILVRKGKVVGDIIRILNGKGIPVDSDNAEYFFEGKYFNKFIETFVILTDFSKDKLFNCWKDIVNINEFNKGFRYLRTIASGSVGNTRLKEIITTFIENIDFLNDTFEDIEERKDAINGITDILNDYDEIFIDYQLSAKIKGLIDFLEDDAAEQYKYHNFKNYENETDAVQVLTVHKSKGLEYDVVFVPNMENGEFPSKNVNGRKYWHVLSNYFNEIKDKFESDIEDERKLFYVAITRAKNWLYLSYEVSKNRPSDFLMDIMDSQYLDIDRNELLEIKKMIAENAKSYPKDDKEKSDSKSMDKSIRDVIRMVRKEIVDDLYAAGHFVHGGAFLEAQEIRQMSDEEFLEKYKSKVNAELQRHGMRLN